MKRRELIKTTFGAALMTLLPLPTFGSVTTLTDNEKKWAKVLDYTADGIDPVPLNHRRQLADILEQYESWIIEKYGNEPRGGGRDILKMLIPEVRVKQNYVSTRILNTPHLGSYCYINRFVILNVSQWQIDEYKKNEWFYCRHSHNFMFEEVGGRTDMTIWANPIKK